MRGAGMRSKTTLSDTSALQAAEHGPISRMSCRLTNRTEVLPLNGISGYWTRGQSDIVERRATGASLPLIRSCRGVCLEVTALSLLAASVRSVRAVTPNTVHEIATWIERSMKSNHFSRGLSFRPAKDGSPSFPEYKAGTVEG